MNLQMQMQLPAKDQTQHEEALLLVEKLLGFGWVLVAMEGRESFSSVVVHTPVDAVLVPRSYRKH